MVSASVRIVKVTLLLERPFTVTTTGPVAAPMGMSAVMPVSLHVVVLSGAPFKVTVLPPFVVPKFEPFIIIVLFAGPDAGERLVISGVTVKVTPVLDMPPTVTTTGPVLAPVGTGTIISMSLQLVGVASIPLKVAVLVPWVEPKFSPLIVTDVPTAPDAGERLLITGETGGPTFLIL